MTETPGRHAHPPTAEDVVAAALAAPLPCPVCGRTAPCRCMKPPEHDRVREKAAVIVAALRQYGHLPSADADPAPPTLDEIHDVARWLAGQSRHVRYADDGWQRIMQSEADVDVAFAQAARDASNAELERLNAARRAILAWTSEHGWEPPRG